MVYDKETAFAIAENLLQIRAVKLSVNKPFTWASGMLSPIYCDNRKTLSYHKIRTSIRQQFVNIIQNEYPSVDVVAGVATGAIAHGILVAQELGVPFVYVRPSEKKHGLGNKIEGNLESGQSVIVIEDLISTGNSSLSAVEAIREAGCEVKAMIAIFSYNLKIALNNFEKANCTLYTLADYDFLIQKAAESNYISESDMSSLIKWRENPEQWATNK